MIANNIAAFLVFPSCANAAFTSSISLVIQCRLQPMDAQQGLHWFRRCAWQVYRRGLEMFLQVVGYPNVL